MTSLIDPSKPVDGVPAAKADLRTNLQAAKTEIEALQTSQEIQIDGLQNSKADVAHVHTFADSVISTSRDLALTDAMNQMLRVDSTDPVLLTVPPASSVVFPLGTILTITRWGTGTVTIAVGPGVTVSKPADRGTSARAQYSVLGLWQKATDDWLLYGDLT